MPIFPEEETAHILASFGCIFITVVYQILPLFIWTFTDKQNNWSEEKN